MAHTISTKKDVSSGTRLTLQKIRNRVTETIEAALIDDQHTLIEALPGTGKSRGVIEAASRRNRPVTIFTCRGRKEQYGQYLEWCDDIGMGAYVLPSSYLDCPTAKGAHGEECQNEIQQLLKQGVPASRVHNEQEWPCQKGGQCPYIRKLDIDPEEYDVILGNYQHAHLDLALNDRVPVFDEFPGDSYFRLH